MRSSNKQASVLTGETTRGRGGACGHCVDDELHGGVGGVRAAHGRGGGSGGSCCCDCRCSFCFLFCGVWAADGRGRGCGDSEGVGAVRTPNTASPSKAFMILGGGGGPELAPNVDWQGVRGQLCSCSCRRGRGKRGAHKAGWGGCAGGRCSSRVRWCYRCPSGVEGGCGLRY